MMPSVVAARRGVLPLPLAHPDPDGEHEGVPVHTHLWVVLPYMCRLHGGHRGHGGLDRVIGPELAGENVDFFFFFSYR